MENLENPFAQEAPLKKNPEPQPGQEANLEGRTGDLKPVIKYMQQAVHKAAQPLTAILTLTELIANSGTLDETNQEDIQVVLEQALQLQAIIREIQVRLKDQNL